MTPNTKVAAGAKTHRLGVCTSNNAAPNPAPAKAPALYAAWNEDMIASPQFLSMTLACAFMATSSTPLAAPKTKAVPIKMGKDLASVGPPREAPNTRHASVMVLPELVIRGARIPTKGIAETAPTANARNTALRRPLDKVNADLISGIAAAHAPTPSPFKKKTAVVENRWTLMAGGSIGAV
jgi:hypothetical protein